MKCKCPACGAVLSLDVLLQHEQASHAVMSALSLNGEFGRLAVQYLGLFRPEKTALTMDRLAKLLNELMEMVKVGVIERNGIQYDAPINCWVDCLGIVLNSRHNIKRPLTSHGYLLEVMTKWKAPSHQVATVVSHYPTHQHSVPSSKTMNTVKGAMEWATTNG